MSYVASHSQPSTTPLPLEGWTITEVIDEMVELAGVRLHRAGVCATDSIGRAAFGSAAEREGSALQRATYELLERSSIVEALARGPEFLPRYALDRSALGCSTRADVFPTSSEPERWQYARSNGVAMGSDWASACRAAAAELVERDRLLRSWYGFGPAPQPIPMTDSSASEHYDWSVLRLPADPGWSAHIEVAFAIGYPRDPDAPLLRGCGAAATLDDACARAMRECEQGLAFLWGEVIPDEAPPYAPTPLFHLDHFLWPHNHALLRAWSVDGHRKLQPADAAGSEVTFVDLTPEGLRGRFYVVKALCDSALPLVFGESPRSVCGDCPPERRVHPLP